MSARTRCTYLGSIKAFLRWCRKTKRIGFDPLEDVEPPRGKAVRVRRALTEAELVKLLDAARSLSSHGGQDPEARISRWPANPGTPAGSRGQA